MILIFNWSRRFKYNCWSDCMIFKLEKLETVGVSLILWHLRTSTKHPVTTLFTKMRFSIIMFVMILKIMVHLKLKWICEYPLVFQRLPEVDCWFRKNSYQNIPLCICITIMCCFYSAHLTKHLTFRYFEPKKNCSLIKIV